MPHHLRNLAGVGREIRLDVSAPVTQRKIIDALEAEYPALSGTVRDHTTQRRRPFVRFFACQQDLSHDDPDAEVPEPVAVGAEPFMVVGAMSGG